jgi:hypothetical protein
MFLRLDANDYWTKSDQSQVAPESSLAKRQFRFLLTVTMVAAVARTNPTKDDTSSSHGTGKYEVSITSTNTTRKKTPNHVPTPLNAHDPRFRGGMLGCAPGIGGGGGGRFMVNLSSVGAVVHGVAID